MQAPDGGIIKEIFVKEGDTVERDQVLALINSTAAEGSLEEIIAKRNSLTAKLVRLDAELKNTDINQLESNLKNFSESVRDLN